MLATIVAKLLGSAGFGFLDRVLGHLEKRANSDIERARIEAGREAANNAHAANVVTTAMQYPLFWIPWLMATVPLAAWFGWGLLDSLANGALPDVAELPPQLKHYADIAWGNVFYSGAGAAGLMSIASAIRRK